MQREWTGVPTSYLQKCDEIFNASKELLNLSSPCPICGEHQLHRWFQVGKPAEKIINGNRFIAQGSLWEWCSSCKSYVHSSAYVPDWWKTDLQVDEKNSQQNQKL
jgi:hypothetical protein